MATTARLAELKAERQGALGQAAGEHLRDNAAMDDNGVAATEAHDLRVPVGVVAGEAAARLRIEPRAVRRRRLAPAKHGAASKVWHANHCKQRGDGRARAASLWQGAVASARGGEVVVAVER